MHEEWKIIESFGKRYSISSFGRVYNTKTKRILKPKVRNKYIIIALNWKGNKKHFSVHRLVMCTFNPIVNPSLYEVHHKDWNPLNNKVSNLEWVTKKQNNQTKIISSKAYKLFHKLLLIHGEDVVFTKLTELK